MALRYYNPSDFAAESETDESPYFVAAWFLARNGEKLGTGRGFDEEWMAEVRRVTIFDVLLWASTYAYHQLDVVDDPTARQAYVQRLLISQTNEHCLEAFRSVDSMQKVTSLWSNLFAPLMVVGPPKGLGYDVAYAIALSQHPPKSSWARRVQMLCNLAHGVADPAGVDGMYGHPFFEEFLTPVDSSSALGSPNTTPVNSPTKAHRPSLSSEEGAGFCIPQEILQTFLELPHLSQRWQVRILSSPQIVLDDKFNTLQHKKNLMDGLKALSSREELRAKGPLRQVLLDLYDRMYPQKKE